VQADLDVFNRWRTYDSVSIAGRRPAAPPRHRRNHPHGVRGGHKAILNTNGLALTRPLLEDLKGAGLVGLTFHVDSHQGRPGWKNKNEIELNELRLEYARLVGSVGGLSCAFNATVYADTVQYVPDLVQFAADHIDLINSMIFIMYRAAISEGDFEFFRDGQKVEVKPLVYAVDELKQRGDLSAQELVSLIRARFPDFSPVGVPRWHREARQLQMALHRPLRPARRTAAISQVMGYVGPKFMELVQNAHHFVKGTYLAYAPQWTLAAGRSTSRWGLIEPGVRTTFVSYLKHLVRRPLDLGRKLHFQSVMMIQPIDILPDGRQNMCDGCPDVTAHDGKIVWSCRLEEYRQYGGLITSTPKARAGCAVASSCLSAGAR
jgi:hypothetical protein